MPDFGICFYAELELILLISNKNNKAWIAPRYLKPSEHETAEIYFCLYRNKF
jgi:hypothetical protein